MHAERRQARVHAPVPSQGVHSPEENVRVSACRVMRSTGRAPVILGRLGFGPCVNILFIRIITQFRWL